MKKNINKLPPRFPSWTVLFEFVQANHPNLLNATTFTNTDAPAVRSWPEAEEAVDAYVIDVEFMKARAFEELQSQKLTEGETCAALNAIRSFGNLADDTTRAAMSKLVVQRDWLETSRNRK